MPERIYIASKARHAPRWRTLQARGCNIISSWIHRAGDDEALEPTELSVQCIEEIRRADRLVLYCEEGERLGGALIEAGAALSAGVPVYSVGPYRSRVFEAHPLWRRCESLSEALGWSSEAKEVSTVPPIPKRTPPAFDALPDLLTVEEFAGWARLNRNTVYDAVRAGTIPHLRFGRTIRIPKAALEEILTGSAGNGAGAVAKGFSVVSR
jgi:excisionase family DNA binding protein